MLLLLLLVLLLLFLLLPLLTKFTTYYLHFPCVHKRLHHERSPIDDLEPLLNDDSTGTSGKFSFIFCSATALASTKIRSTSSPPASNVNEALLSMLPTFIIMSLKALSTSTNSVSTSDITPDMPDLTLVNAPTAGPMEVITSPISIVDSNLSCICSTDIFTCEIILVVLLICANSFDIILTCCASCFCKFNTTWLKSVFSFPLKFSKILFSL